MEKPTRKQAGLAMCHECMGYWADGKVDCETVRCPQYYYQPYRKLEPDLGWMNYNPARQGKVTWEESKRDITDEQREKLSQNMREVLKARQPVSRVPVKD